MSYKKRIKKPLGISLSAQLWALQSGLATPGAGRVRNNRLVWNFRARPSPVSREYIVRILYKQGKSPDVIVLQPALIELAGKRTIPHIYSEDPLKLCLYLPDANEWTPQKLLAHTVVPWTFLWLFFFEDWLSTNEWHGGGVHHSHAA